MHRGVPRRDHRGRRALGRTEVSVSDGAVIRGSRRGRPSHGKHCAVDVYPRATCLIQDGQAPLSLTSSGSRDRSRWAELRRRMTRGAMRRDHRRAERLGGLPRECARPRPSSSSAALHHWLTRELRHVRRGRCRRAGRTCEIATPIRSAEDRTGVQGEGHSCHAETIGTGRTSVYRTRGDNHESASGAVSSGVQGSPLPTEQRGSTYQIALPAKFISPDGHWPRRKMFANYFVQLAPVFGSSPDSSAETNRDGELLSARRAAFSAGRSHWPSRAARDRARE